MSVNTTMVTVLVSRNRPDLYTVPALVALVPNLVLSVILIPPHGADGAAIAAVAAAAVLTSISVPRTARLFGSVSLLRVLPAPLAAGSAMALCAAALPDIPWVLGAIAAAAAYAATFLALERVFTPGDFAFYSAAVRRSRG